MTLLTMLYRPSLLKLEALRDKLKALDIRKYPGENITLFTHDASKLVCEIRMNFMKNSTVDDLTTVALTGLHACSEELIRIKVRTISMDNDVNGFESGIGNQKADALEVLQEMEDMYRVLVNLKAYAPAQQLEKKPPTLSGYQASTPDALVQDRTASRNTRRNAGAARPPGQCWDCGSTDHFRGDPKCTKTLVSPATPHPPRHGLDDATAAKVTELAAAKLTSMPPRENILDEAEYSIAVEGKIVAKYCRHCGRFVKGDSQHFTKDHTGLRTRFPYKAPAATTPPSTLPSALSPTVRFAPTVSAALANLSHGVPPPNVPTIDSTAYLFRHQSGTNYDFSSMTTQANVARMSLPEVPDSDDDDFMSFDDDSLHSILVNEFGG
jgi:hypothetical protein